MKPFHLIINGRKVPTGSCFEVLNPANEKVAGLASLARRKDLDDAVGAARTAFRKWREVPEAKRQAACLEIASGIEENAEELARMLTAEQGKPLNGLGSRWEVGGAVAWTRYTAGLSLPVKVLQNNDEGRVELHRKPIGVVGSITPWNFPVLIAVWHIVPAVLSGNTVVCKPSPYTPLSTLRLVELMNEVLPEGVVNCIAGKDSLGAAMTAHEGIGKIVFTGSCATGQKIMVNSAETMKRLTLELGGNDAGIVLPDVNPGQIAEGLFWGAFINSGQTCAALKRLYVHDDVYDEVCDELVAFARKMKVGEGTDEDVVLGPVQNRRQYDIVTRLVRSAESRGRVLLGGDPGETRGETGGEGIFLSAYDHSRPRKRGSPCRRGTVRPRSADHPLSPYRGGDREGKRQSERPRGFGLEPGHGKGKGDRKPHGMRLGLDKQARDDPAQRPVRRGKTLGLRR